MDDPVRNQTRWGEFIHLPGAPGSLSFPRSWLPPPIAEGSSGPHHTGSRWSAREKQDHKASQQPRSHHNRWKLSVSHMQSQGTAGQLGRAGHTYTSILHLQDAGCVSGADYFPCTWLDFLLWKMGIIMCNSGVIGKASACTNSNTWQVPQKYQFPFLSSFHIFTSDSQL